MGSREINGTERKLLKGSSFATSLTTESFNSQAKITAMTCMKWFPFGMAKRQLDSGSTNQTSIRGNIKFYLFPAIKSITHKSVDCDVIVTSWPGDRYGWRQGHNNPMGLKKMSGKKCEEHVCRKPIIEPSFTFYLYIYIHHLEFQKVNKIMKYNNKNQKNR